VLALQADGISDLVEMASAFATAGIFIALVFGLFTGWGGAPSAYAAIVVGAVVWACGKFALDMQAPYVSGVLAALLAYVLVTIATRSAAAERRTCA